MATPILQCSIAPGSIQLSWQPDMPSSPVDEIYRSTDGINFIFLIGLAPGIQSYTDTTAVSGQHY